MYTIYTHADVYCIQLKIFFLPLYLGSVMETGMGTDDHGPLQRHRPKRLRNQSYLDSQQHDTIVPMIMYATLGIMGYLGYIKAILEAQSRIGTVAN